MNIYFATSISGGRENFEVHKELIEHTKKYGKVLTEQIADPNLTHLGETNLSPQEIYLRDLNWLINSDVIIAEVSTPSLGVGYEIATAEKLNKPILCLYKEQENKRLSAMIGGNKRLKVKIYQKIEEAKKFIDEFFKEIEFKKI